MYSEFDLEILENQIANFTNAFPTSNMHQLHIPVYEQITPPQSPNGMKSVSGNRKRRPRTTFTPHQILSLETEFSINNHLTRHRKIVIARALNLEEKQVNVWFQNRRMKAKKLAEKEKVVTGSTFQVAAPIDPIYPQLSVEEIKKRLIAVEQIPGLVHHPLDEEPKTDYNANNIISNETSYYISNAYTEHQIAPSNTESDCSVFDNQSFTLYENSGNVQIESDLSNQSDYQVGDNKSFVFWMNDNAQVSPSNETYLDTSSEELQELLSGLNSNYEVKPEVNPGMEILQDFTTAFLNL